MRACYCRPAAVILGKRLSPGPVVLVLLIALELALPSFALPAAGRSDRPASEAISPGQAVGMIDRLTREILLKEIELQRFNLQYTLAVAKQGRWKGLRYALLQEANTALNLAGAIISTDNRGDNLFNAGRVSLYPQEAANYIPMLGSIIGASAASAEFGINGYHEIMARKRGFSPSASVKRVCGLKDDIERLLALRDELIASEASDPALARHVLVDRAEGKVLRDTLDQSLHEFARYHIGARRLLAFQQAQYLFDAAKYTTGAIGSDFAYLSLSRGRRIWNGRAGVFFAVSGQLTVWGPILSRLIGRGVGALTRQRMQAVLAGVEAADIATLKADLAALNSLSEGGLADEAPVAMATERQAIFAAHEKAFSSEISAHEKAEAAAKLTATENILAGAFVGGAKTASAVLFLVPGFNRNYNGKTRRSGHVTNDLLFASAVVGLPANAFAMLDTLRIQVAGELKRRQARRAGQLPAQIARSRLQELDEMERRLRAM